MSSSYIGKVVDNYRIIENLGIGGMGVVFKAIHVKLDKLFALKMIAPGLAMNENFIKRFQTEAKALAKFEDPNIVRIYDLRQHDDQWFIVMEYVEGKNLLDIIRKDGAFPLQNALAVLKQILAAIGHAHSAGIIHRDLKPNNVMISTSGNVKITDFGLAKDQSSKTKSITVTSGGTLYYMSPEHVKGFQFTDKRSDIYSIGMTFYEMITGTVPFKDLQSDFEIRESIMRKDTVKPSTYNDKIPVDLENIVMKSISRDPNDRYQTTEEMLEAIKIFEAHNPDIDSDFALVEIPRSVRYAESEFKFGKVPDPKPSKIFIKNKKHLKIAVIISSIIAVCLLILYNFYPLSENGEKIAEINEHFSHLTISTQPSAAAVILEDDTIGLAPVNQYRLKPGKYSLNISKTNFLPIDTTIVLTADNNLDLSLILRSSIQKKNFIAANKVSTSEKRTSQITANNAIVQINSNPTDSEVFVNGEFQGNTPLNITELPAGRYKVMIKKEGFDDYISQVNLKSGQNSEFLADLLPLTGSVTINTNPISAKILLDGREIENSESPITLDNIAVGKHTIEIQKGGYLSVSEEINVGHNETVNRNFDLIQLQGKMTIQVRPWGSIYINDEIKKESADTKYQVTLPVEDYKVKVTHPTLGFWEQIIKVKADVEEEIIINFNRKFSISVSAFDENGFPLNAEIFIDDKTTGKSTPAEIETRVGNHKLKLIIDGYNTNEVEKVIFVDQDEKNEHIIILKKTA